MPRQYRDADGSTEPIVPPPSYNNVPPTQGQIVVGSFKNQSPPHQPYAHPPRQPYAYPPRQPYQEPTETYNPNAPFQAPYKRRRRNPVLRFGCLTMLALLVIVIVLGVITV